MEYSKQRSRDSRSAIERLYITMRHLFSRGSYKPNGVSGEQLREALLTLSPEIYGDIANPEKVDLDGLLYVAERLPQGIEECRFVHLVAREGFEQAGHKPIIPLKRRRNCYRVDKDRMYVEMSRGRSDIYDILTHLTYLYLEADKIKQHGLDHRKRESDTWLRLKEVVRLQETEGAEQIPEKEAIVYLSQVLGRTILQTQKAVEAFKKSKGPNNLYRYVYHLGQVAIAEEKNSAKKEIFMSAKLRNIVGHHAYGEHWANNIKKTLLTQGLMERPIHIISANLHSVVNTIYGCQAFAKENFETLDQLAAFTSKDPDGAKASTILNYAQKHGFTELEDQSGTNLNVQIIDLAKVKTEFWPFEHKDFDAENAPVLIVMDYAFGEQAYECMDELLKNYKVDDLNKPLLVESISIMGKAGILSGKKGDLMIPTAHVFEGTADNYPLENDLSPDDFKDCGLAVKYGPMITVLGTSLQNRDVLHHFLTSTWNAIGVEMEGAHYQKAIQSAARIRNSISKDVKVRYAYYASDNPLESGSTLASGSLGAEGVFPTYLITQRILEKIFI